MGLLAKTPHFPSHSCCYYSKERCIPLNICLRFIIPGKPVFFLEAFPCLCELRPFPVRSSILQYKQKILRRNKLLNNRDLLFIKRSKSLKPSFKLISHVVSLQFIWLVITWQAFFLPNNYFNLALHISKTLILLT